MDLDNRIANLELRLERLESVYYNTRERDSEQRHILLQELAALERRLGISPTTKELRKAAKKTQ